MKDRFKVAVMWTLVHGPLASSERSAAMRELKKKGFIRKSRIGKVVIWGLTAKGQKEAEKHWKMNWATEDNLSKLQI